jgi:DNA-directed RNA polymerase
MEFKNGILLNEAENKFLFLAFIFEYIKINNTIKYEQESFVYTQLPIQLDATCNGYQHLSMLSRDKSLAESLNLTRKSDDNVPEDFYGLMMNRVLKEVASLESELDNANELDADSSEKLASYKRIIAFNAGRWLLKKALMITSYNAH